VSHASAHARLFAQANPRKQLKPSFRSVSHALVRHGTSSLMKPCEEQLNTHYPEVPKRRPTALTLVARRNPAATCQRFDIAPSMNTEITRVAWCRTGGYIDGRRSAYQSPVSIFSASPYGRETGHLRILYCAMSPFPARPTVAQTQICRRKLFAIRRPLCSRGNLGGSTVSPDPSAAWFLACS
jgi:hypothetical protein